MKIFKYTNCLIALTVVLFTGLVIGFPSSAAAVDLEVGQEAPEFSLTDVEGNEYTLSDYRGESVVLVDFWASWCPSCIREIRVVNRLMRDYCRKGLVVLGVNIKDSESKVKDIIKKHKPEYTMLLDRDGSVSKAYGVKGLPYLILIDREGKIRWLGHWLDKEAQAMIEEIL